MERKRKGPGGSRRRRGSRQSGPRSGSARRQPSAHPLRLRHVDEPSLATMDPADIILLAEAESLRAAVESVFFAVLACPACGTLGLITLSQYLGTDPVICGSNRCSCRFRIDNKSRLIYLPVN
jgi:hypothetical protein